MLHHNLRSLFHRRIAAIRIERPWHPGLIRGGQGRLPKRIQRPKPALHSADAQRWIAASRSVRRLLQKIAKVHAARNLPRQADSSKVEPLAGWDFVFLSADMDAFHDAGAVGIDYRSRLAFQKSKRGSDAAWAAASSKVRARMMGAVDRVEVDDNDRASS